MPKLKLFKAVSGFHDSYVAAPSRAAALRAWGARTDLFAMGAAEQIDDPAILAEASKSPGKVLQKKRTGGGKLEERSPKPAKKKPDRAKLERARCAAERKLADAVAAKNAELKKLDADIARATARREKAAARHERAIAKLQGALEEAETALAG